jgi:hypothetical protein
LTHGYLIKFFIFKKIQKNIFQKKKNSGQPLGTKGWLAHPHGAKGGGKNHPNGGLGVVLATPWCPREKQEIKKQTARFFSYIHQYHHYKNPKPKTLMVRRGEAPPFPLLYVNQSFIRTPSSCTAFAAEFQRLVSMAEFHRNSLTIGGGFIHPLSSMGVAPWCPIFFSLFFL